MTRSGLTLADRLADIPFIDEEIAALLRKQKQLRATWLDLDKLLASEHLSPAARKLCLEFIVRSELLRILREGWRAHFPEHTPHSLHSLSEIQMWLFFPPGNVPAWLRIVLSKLETFPMFLGQYLSNPGAWARGPWTTRNSEDEDGAFEPAISKYVDQLCRTTQGADAVTVVSKRRKARTTRPRNASATSTSKPELIPPHAHSEFGHSEDYRTVVHQGKDYQLTLNQAKVIESLHKAYETGLPNIGLARLLEDAEIQSRRLADVFKGNRAALKALVVSGGKRKGTYRLNLESKPSAKIPQ